MGKFEVGMRNLEANMTDEQVVASVINPKKIATAKKGGRADREKPNSKRAEDRKTARVNLAFTEAVAEQIKDEAWEQHISVNQFITDLVADYFKKKEKQHK